MIHSIRKVYEVFSKPAGYGIRLSLGVERVGKARKSRTLLDLERHGRRRNMVNFRHHE